VTRVRRQTSRQGASARATTGWLVVVALVIAALGSVAAGQRSAPEQNAPLGFTAHLVPALDALTPVATATAFAHVQSPRPLPAAEIAGRTLIPLLIGLASIALVAASRVRMNRAALPPRRAPPLCPSSR